MQAKRMFLSKLLENTFKDLLPNVLVNYNKELVWNYGETRKSITDSNPWLKY